MKRAPARPREPADAERVLFFATQAAWRPGSNWSDVNLRRVEALIEDSATGRLIGPMRRNPAT